MAELVRVAVTTLASAVVLFLMTKLMGNKQISQLTMFDYVVGITIGSIAAEMSTELETPEHSVVALVVYGVLAFVISMAVQRSPAARRYIDGRAWVLLDNGKLYRDNFKKVRMDVSEFLSICRVEGYFDLRQVQTAIMEPNGKISFLPVEANRPATPADLGQQPSQEKAMITLITDGHLLQENLKMAGKDEVWLGRQLKGQGVSSVTDVFLALTDDKGELAVYPMNTRSPRRDPFA